MKYFTKYLPVEGKVEMGDYFIDTGVMSNGTLIGKRANKEGVYDYQKVKLFLCSMDIQVGDTCILPDWPKQKKVTDSDDAIYFSKQGGYKVIGEISPEALSFVKEGQEFDEREIEFIAQGAGTIYYKLNPKEFEDKFVGAYLTYYIKVKGPCGHFH